MDEEKPPSYTASMGGNPAYPPTATPQQYAYPPPMQNYPPQGYPPQYPPQGGGGYSQEPAPTVGYVNPPIIAPPPYGSGGNTKTTTGGGHNQVDVEASLENHPVIRGVVSFNEKSIRLGFIRKVFGILLLQILVTVGMTAWFLLHPPTRSYVQNNYGLYIGSYVVFLVLYFVLVCCSGLARKHPTNLILLAIFTLSLAYMVAAISTYHETKIVLAAFGMTVFCTLGVIIFASQTKYDVTKCSGVLFCACFSLFIFGIFAGVLVPYGYMRIVNVVYAALGALLFMGFLAFDIQTIMGGKKYEVSPEDYVYAALQLYVDVIYIFLFILQIFGGGSK